MMLDTGNGGQVELEAASVRMASGNTLPPRQPDAGSRVADQTTTPSRTANVVTRDQGDDEGPRTVRFTGDPPPRQPAARPSITSHDDDQQDDDTDGFVEYAGSTAGNTGSHAAPPVPRADPPIRQPVRREAPRAPAPAMLIWASSPSTPMREVVREYHRPKKMRLPKYKELDGNMAVSTWLRAVQTETRRQERTLGVHWDPDEVYYEMASHLEALRWYGNIMSAITDETDENLSRLLRARYGEQRSDPEVVASLHDRKQMRGEPLVEYAAALPEIVADRNIGEEWLVDEFLNGMSNATSATHVRGREPQTLDEAVRVATRQVGKFGEGHRVDLEAAMAKQDKRANRVSKVRSDSTPLGAATPLGHGGKEQSASAGNVGQGMIGFGNGLPVQKPPRYDIDGRLVNPPLTTGWGAGVTVIPQGYTLVPLGTQTGSSSKAQPSSSRVNQPTTVNRGPRGDDGGGLQGRRHGRTLQVEAQGGDRAPLGVLGGASRYGPQPPQSRQPLKTKEERLANHRRYQASR
ncbi:hypothetical protein PF010_g29600 [Phytophthora fragariae]|uniref:Retrotransposon gag domain-containing protein n=1 Tax=Phytophthora fragariae TaxID=53985 RepID=A0A6G0JMR5_9STRA|nr:hypothetical protein PF010_g29600 [Phytophthora fragariae]